MKPIKFINQQYLWDEFKEKVLPELTDKKSTLKLEEHKLGKPMTNTEIQWIHKKNNIGVIFGIL